MRTIERPLYMNQLLDCIGTPDIKVITGIRRCGKSKLLEALQDHLLAQEDTNVVFINYSLDEFEPLLDYHQLLDYAKARHMKGLSNFLLIDEVQMCSGFEKALNSLHAQGLFDLFVTGSNAFLLSSDLATLFTGRTFAIQVYPFSFAEFCKYFGLVANAAALTEYAKFGGMAGSYLYKNEQQRYRYLADVFHTLVVRDIRQRYRLRDVSLLERITDFLVDNSANISSVRSVSDALHAGGSSATPATVGSYMGYLTDAFAFYKVRRFDISGRKYLQSGEKFYLADHAFRFALLGTRNMDWGRTLENMVALELMRRGYEVYAGVLYKTEIDFVAVRQGEKLYIQVSDDISAPATFEREVGALLKVRDAYPKLLLARTGHETYDHEGIQIHDLATWLAN